METNATVAQSIAPEDLAAGQYVTPLTRLREHMPFFCTEEAFKDRAEPYRMTCLPKVRAPVRVVEVCLPFVLIETPKGTTRMIDLRRYRLARVSDRFGRIMFDQAQKAAAAETSSEESEEDVLQMRFE